jgi:hypothetical protein
MPACLPVCLLSKVSGQSSQYEQGRTKKPACCLAPLLLQLTAANYLSACLPACLLLQCVGPVEPGEEGPHFKLPAFLLYCCCS